MAMHELIHVTPSPNHPMANPGYGKRAVPQQGPLAADDFAHLPVREASIAALIDMLVDGAVISGKALAAAHPLYGQAACLTALNNLSRAGHLRRVRERLDGADGSCRWVTRTHFSRTPHDDAWWQEFCAVGVAPADRPPADPPPPADRPPAPSQPPRTVAYNALAELSRVEPRLTLSDADCTNLAPLAAEWLARDPSRRRFNDALCAGLPPQVHRPAGLLKSRLEVKLPPLPRPSLVMECTQCGAQFGPKLLPGGLCPGCRSAPPPPPAAAEAEVRIDIRPYMDDMRAAVRNAKGTHRT